MQSAVSFETARLILRPRTLDDFEACLAMDAEPDMLRYVGLPWQSEAEHRAFVRQRIETAYPPGLGYWCVAPKAEPARFLGWVLLCSCSVAGAEVEIGWRFTRAARGHSFATEAAAPILAQGFARQPMQQVVADIHPENVASMRVAEKIGLTYKGMVDYHGEPARRYGITRADFERLHDR